MFSKKFLLQFFSCLATQQHSVSPPACGTPKQTAMQNLGTDLMEHSVQQNYVIFMLRL